MTGLPDAFLRRPIAHRAFHDVVAGRPENSRAAIRAAVMAGYGIEIDVQLSADGQAMVFHDYDLGRLTAAAGPVRMLPARELTAIPLIGTGEGIPTLDEVLSIIDGAVPLLVEVKDQDGALGPDVGVLEKAVATALQGYSGDVAVMSFNPHSVAAFGRAAPDRPRGLATCRFDALHWHLVPRARRKALTEIPDFDAVGAMFISHEVGDLARPRVAELKRSGVPVLSWTIRSAAQEAKARKIADNVTFEGYAAAVLGA